MMKHDKKKNANTKNLKDNLIEFNSQNNVFVE